MTQLVFHVISSIKEAGIGQKIHSAAAPVMPVARILRTAPAANIAEWLAPLGLCVRLLFHTLSFDSLQSLRFAEFQTYCQRLGKRSFHFVTLASTFVAISLTIECVIELQKYRAEDFSGAVIAIGLLRELGPLTISLAWCAHVAAFMSEEAVSYGDVSDREFAARFICPRYLAALAMSVPLGAYGLIFGFVTAALVAPLLGVNSTSDFLESSKQGIQNKDLFIYFIKLIVINPTIGVFAGCAAGRLASRNVFVPVGANAVTATFLVGYIANAMVTFAAYVG